MNRKNEARPRWSTSSFGRPADTSPGELAALGQHLDRCNGQRGALSSLHRAGEAVNDFAAPRVMTTLALFTLLLVVIVSLLT
ncbi:MAG: hypothetical protein ABI887_18595 [Burkholderiales bacterium]